MKPMYQSLLQAGPLLISRFEKKKLGKLGGLNIAPGYELSFSEKGW